MAANLLFRSDFFVLFFNLLCIFVLLPAKITFANETTISSDIVTTVGINQFDTTTPAPETKNTQTGDRVLTDIGECTCDLTANGCDVNCCCDPDCDDDDRNVFSRCDDEYSPADSQTCVKSYTIVIDNTPYEKNETHSDLFCVYFDNNEQRNYYGSADIDIIDNEADFDQLAEKYGGSSYKPAPSDDIISTDPYQSGDPIYTYYDNDVVSHLGLPAPLTSGSCIDTNPAAFLYDQTFDCNRQGSLQDVCQDWAVNANSYFEGFRIVGTPEFFGLNETSSPPEYATTETSLTSTVTATTVRDVSDRWNHTYLIDVIPAENHTCMDATGNSSQCSFPDGIPTPIFNSTNNFCSYAGVQNMSVRFNKQAATEHLTREYLQQPGFWLSITMNNLANKHAYRLTPGNATTRTEISFGQDALRVRYRLLHNTSHGITAAEVTFVFATITEQNLPLSQTFRSEFIKPGENDTFRRSGNPGYKFAEPLMVGNLTCESNEEDVSMCLIWLDADRNNWLTMLTSDTSGNCANNANNRIPVTFDQEMRSGCVNRVQYSNMNQGTCDLLQDSALEALRGSNPYVFPHVARFGNTSVTEPNNWVPILDELAETQNTVTYIDGKCTNVVTGMHMEFMYANVGALGNPQAKIIGGRYYYTREDITFKCSGPYCHSNKDGDKAQKFEVVSSVGFIDASNPPEGVSAEIPTATARLPEDFFYPFT